MKRKIRLTEGSLKKMVGEAVRKITESGYFGPNAGMSFDEQASSRALETEANYNNAETFKKPRKKEEKGNEWFLVLSSSTLKENDSFIAYKFVLSAVAAKSIRDAISMAMTKLENGGDETVIGACDATQDEIYMYSLEDEELASGTFEYDVDYVDDDWIEKGNMPKLNEILEYFGIFPEKDRTYMIAAGNGNPDRLGEAALSNIISGAVRKILREYTEGFDSFPVTVPFEEFPSNMIGIRSILEKLGKELVIDVTYTPKKDGASISDWEFEDKDLEAMLPDNMRNAISRFIDAWLIENESRLYDDNKAPDGWKGGLAFMA